ncbi:MAG: alpha/beta fold hydrolase [Trichodesmium sp. ALOHA_ZT_67]|nr:alpha/beta fold hydrolase [Trichodesmium sp. ALOHA_ZT_67]MDE5096666.1 alpha/beta fold hydrolase [Trichodesmium sp. St11_bin5]
MSSELKRLEQINEELVRVPNLTRHELLGMKVIQESQELVHRVGATNKPTQSLPFTKLYLPMAFTGILEPKKLVDKTHRAIQILLPGTGTTFSVAETLCDVAGTFHGRKSKNRGTGRKSNQSLLTELLPEGETFRVASFPADLPLNGMGSDAPFEFASEHGLMTIIRHVHLVLSRLYPDRPVFIAGRSQGGIAGIMYAQHYHDLAGAIAVNPPHPDPELFQFTVQYLEEKAGILADLLHAPGVTLHDSSWEAYKTFTPNFNYPSRPSLSPILILVSLGDPFNLFPQYLHKLQEFAENDEKCKLHILDAGHNLWDRKSVDTYQDVINLHIQFMLNQIKFRL